MLYTGEVFNKNVSQCASPRVLWVSRDDFEVIVCCHQASVFSLPGFLAAPWANLDNQIGFLFKVAIQELMCSLP